MLTKLTCRLLFTALACLATLATLAAPAANDAPAGRRGYYRFPALYGDTVIFTAEGDLWSCAAAIRTG